MENKTSLLGPYLPSITSLTQNKRTKLTELSANSSRKHRASGIFVVLGCSFAASNISV